MKNDLELLEGPIGGKIKLDLLYRATRNGFSSLKFHECVDNKGPTLHVIQSENGHIFGGFTSQSWTSNTDGANIPDEKSFIFSLTKKSIHKPYRNKEYAIYHHKDMMSCFGNDICIKENCDKNK